ncbi:MAG: hypothetical protein EOO15_01755 [Chitinophagaceae bacterium]|nr:MAG: hypothetical protein EOO15_01755 [Chitinophagaceae bacterium]
MGTTDDVQRRLSDHNHKHYSNAFTCSGIPWTAYLSIPCASSSEAYFLERFIKQMKSASFIQRLNDSPSLIEEIKKKFKG